MGISSSAWPGTTIATSRRIVYRPTVATRKPCRYPAKAMHGRELRAARITVEVAGAGEPDPRGTVDATGHQAATGDYNGETDDASAKVTIDAAGNAVLRVRTVSRRTVSGGGSASTSGPQATKHISGVGSVERAEHPAVGKGSRRPGHGSEGSER